MNKILLKKAVRYKIDDEFVKRAVDKVLVEKKLDGIELSVYLVGRVKARKLNIKYRKMSYYPQMLEFPMSKVRDVDGWIRLGDLVICWELFERELKRTKATKDKLLTEWLVHGITNLLK